jgi:hypothetical protein
MIMDLKLFTDLIEALGKVARGGGKYAKHFFHSSGDDACLEVVGTALSISIPVCLPASSSSSSRS